MPTKSTKPRRLRDPDPVRLPLPLQDPCREDDLRERLTRHFQPANPVEEMWVEDIAYCGATIEHIRATIAAFQQHCAQSASRNLLNPMSLELDGEVSGLSSLNRIGLDMAASRNFTPRSGRSDLADPLFSQLLGARTPAQQHQLALLHAMLHAELRERDRLINKMESRHVPAMLAAITAAEAELASRERGHVSDGAEDQPASSAHATMPTLSSPSGVALPAGEPDQQVGGAALGHFVGKLS